MTGVKDSRSSTAVSPDMKLKTQQNGLMLENSSLQCEYKKTKVPSHEG